MKILALGESLARMSSFDGQRLSNATQLNLTYGGAESNVAVNLSQLNHSVNYATKIPQNLLAKNLVSLLKANGVNIDHVIHGGDRLGTYFVEGGAGLRPSRVIYDRAYSAIAMMTENEWDLDQLFEGVDLFHTTGITLALSESWHEIGLELIKAAHSRNIPISFDMNFRSALWSTDTAKEVYQKLLPYISYLSASKLDAIVFMDIEEDSSKSNDDYIRDIASKYPNLKVIFGTNRVNKTPNQFDYQGFYYDTSEESIVKSDVYDLNQVVDRVGAGDSYAAGVLDGIIQNKKSKDIVDFATAAAVLKHTIHGDINRFTREDIEQFMTNTENIIR